MAIRERTRSVDELFQEPEPEVAKPAPDQGGERGYVIERDRYGMWRPKPQAGGPLPHELSGAFTTKIKALKAISDHFETRRTDKLPVQPT